MTNLFEKVSLNSTFLSTVVFLCFITQKGILIAQPYADDKGEPHHSQKKVVKQQSKTKALKQDHSKNTDTSNTDTKNTDAPKNDSEDDTPIDLDALGGAEAPVDLDAIDGAEVPLDLDKIDQGQKPSQPDSDDQSQKSSQKKPRSKDTLIKSESTITKKVKSKSDSIKTLTLDTVSILGNSERISRVSGSAHKVGQEQLEAQEYDDVHRVLKQVPGVYVRDEDGFGLRPNIGLRGANSDRSAKVTLMEDGVLMAPAPYSAPAAYYFPLTTRLTGIEVFKGPASIQYGPNTIGGAVNLVTRSAPIKGKVGGVDLSYGSFQSEKVHLHLGQGWKYFGYVIEGARLSSSGFKELDNGGETGFDKHEAMLKIRANNGLNKEIHHRIELKLGFANEQSNETYLGLSDADFTLSPYRRYAASQLDLMEWWRTQVKLSYALYIGDSLDIKLTAYRHDFVRTWDKFNGLVTSTTRIEDVLADPQSPRNKAFYEVIQGNREWVDDPNERIILGRNHREYFSQGIQSALDWRLKGDQWQNTLTVGMRFHQDEIVRDHTERQADMINRRLIPQDTPATLVLNNQGKSTAISGFIFDQLNLFKRIRVAPGFRVESYDTELIDLQDRPSRNQNENIFLPGIGIWAGLSDQLGLIGGVHRGFSPLGLGLGGDLNPETSINSEFGLRWDRGWFKGELIGFLNQYQNLVGTCTQSAGCAIEDIDNAFSAGSAKIQGIEWVSELRAPLSSKLEGLLSINYTFTDARFEETFSSQFSQWGEVIRNDILPYVPQHQASARLSIDAMNYGLGAVASYVGEMRDRASQGTIEDQLLIPSQLILDSSAYIRPWPKGKLYLGVDNVLNQDNISSRRPFGARPGKPFMIRLGYKHQL